MKKARFSRLFIGAVLLVALLYALYVLLLPKRGEVIERWETGNEGFRIRVTAYNEKNTFPAHGGGYYVFESAGIGSETWNKILTFRHDDPVTIPKDQINYVSEEIAYVFMGWMYGVTTDGGEHWSVWDARHDLPQWQCCNYGLIESVELNSNGTGTMRLHVISASRGEVPELRTSDYGRNWFR